MLSRTHNSNRKRLKACGPPIPRKALGDVPKTSHPSPQGQIHLVGGRKGMGQSMTATEAARLIDWLKANGHSAEEATECIKYIATGIQQPQQNQ